MTLQEVIKEIKKVKPFADQEVAETPRETLGGRLSRQRQAKEKLKSLTESYARELVSSSAFMLVSGPTAQEFSDIAVANYECFSANADDFFQDLANRIPSVLYNGKPAGSNLLDVVSRHLEDKAMDLGILGYPQLIFKQEYRRELTSKADLVILLKQMLNDQLGSEVIGINACRSLVNEAIARGHDAKVTPVILVINEVDVDAAVVGLKRLTKSVATVKTGDTTSKDIVDAIMSKSNLKPRTVVETVVVAAALETSELNVEDIVSDVADQVSAKKAAAAAKRAATLAAKKNQK